MPDIVGKRRVADSAVTLSGGFRKGIRSIFTRGEEVFEISNHLGNVLTTVSDRKVAFDQNTDGTIDFFRADVISAQDYYAFGMIMPGRKFSAGGSYRFGFNGKEEDDDVKGDGNQQDYGMRIYDARLGRFLSVDPITEKYPELTPYQFASNRPIDGIDLDGMEYVKRIHTVNSTGEVIATKDIVYYTMSEQQIRALGGTPAGRYNSAPYGPEGKGIKHEYYLQNGTKANIPDKWNLKGSFATHGLYSGDGSITYTGKVSTNGKQDYDHSWKPIDAADAIAKRHDINYSKVGAYDVVEDSRTLSADLQMVDEATNYLNSVPFRLITGQRVAGETIVAAEGQKHLMTIFADYKKWKLTYMISIGLDPKSEADNKTVSLDRWYYRFKYINSVKGEKTKRTGYLAVLLEAKSKTK
jgi:RHS repeat-associated protein